MVGFATWLTWRRREAPAGRELLWLLGSVLIWTLASAMEAISHGLSLKLLWAKIEYVGATNTGPFALVFCIAFSGHNEWRAPRKLVLLWILPVITLLLATTNELHHLIWSALTPTPTPADNLYIYHPGAVFWVYIAYTYAYATIGALLLLQEFLGSSSLYRRQSGIILFSMIFPWVGGGLYVFGLNPMPGLDLTPVSFAFTAIVIAWGLSSAKLLDLIPVAHRILLQSMQDGVIVMDVRHRIVETNPAMARLLGQAELPVGGDAFDTFREWPALAAVLRQVSELHCEIELTRERFRYFDVRVTPLLDAHKRLEGQLIVLRETTRRKKAELALQAKTQEMEQQVVTDDLTGLYNRRYINRLLEEEFSRSQRYSANLSIALLDIDDFKQINDRSGHHVGDEILRLAGNILQTSLLRTTDVAARIGGDEFLLIFPHTDLHGACEVAERVRTKIQEGFLKHTGLPVSASAGVTSRRGDDSPETLLQRVDQLLYEAKSEGKNRVVKDH